MPLEPGLAASFDHTVGADDSAIAFGSGDVPVLATPRLVALAEGATFRAVAGELTDDLTTVGVRVELDHVLPSALGALVHIATVLERIDGRRLTFGVRVTDRERVVAEGTIVRVIVTRERFLRVLGT
jgi:predicted thioesterase